MTEKKKKERSVSPGDNSAEISMPVTSVCKTMLVESIIIDESMARDFFPSTFLRSTDFSHRLTNHVYNRN